MIQAPLSSRRTSCHVLAALLVVVGAAGCGGPAYEDQPRTKRSLAELSAERPVAMRGEEAFFNGQLTAQVTVSRGLGRGERLREEYRQRDSNVYVIDDPDFESAERAERIAIAQARRNLGSTAPTVMIRLKLTNTTGEPVDVEILEINSSLGNFAVRPDRLTVPAQESAQPEPMNSRLGVTADEIPVTVSLRIGDRTETHAIVVKNLLAPAPTKQ